MAKITEFTGLEGGFQDPKELKVNGGVPLLNPVWIPEMKESSPEMINEINLICYPFEKISYNRNRINETVIYQIYEISHLRSSKSIKFAVVAGYQRSMPYAKDKRMAMGVETVSGQERSQLEKIMKNTIKDKKCFIGFWEKYED